MKLDSNIHCSVVIPVFNEKENIEELYTRLTHVLVGITLQYEIIYVNDGSTDNSIEILRKISDSDRKVKVVDLSRNFGHQIAISAGISYSVGDVTVSMDGDLQDSPSAIPEFIKKWKEGFFVVYGIRRKRKESLLKRVCYHFFYRLQGKLTNINIPFDAGDFCLMDKKVVDVLKKMPERNRFIRGIRSWVGYPQIGIEIERDIRFDGEPKYNFKSLVKLAFDGIFSFSDIPLKMSAITGFCISVFCFFYIGYIAFQRVVHGTTVYGISTIIVLVLFLGGIQLIAIGIIGEYIGRIYDEVKQRPVFVIKELINL